MFCLFIRITSTHANTPLSDLSLNLSVSTICLSIRLSARLSLLSLFVFVSTYLPLSLYVCGGSLSICLSVSRSFFTVCLSVCLSVCLFVRLSIGLTSKNAPKPSVMHASDSQMHCDPRAHTFSSSAWTYFDFQMCFPHRPHTLVRQAFCQRPWHPPFEGAYLSRHLHLTCVLSSAFFPRASERRVLLIVGVCQSSS